MAQLSSKSQNVNPRQSSYGEVVSQLKFHNDFCIFSHANPDPDAYASALALTCGLLSIGKNASCYICQENRNHHFDFLPLRELLLTEVPEIEEKSCVITTDCSGVSLLDSESQKAILDHGVDINIDHHRSNNSFAETNLVDYRSSASEVVYRILEELEVSFHPALATLILAGIYHDTGSLQYPGIQPETFRTVAKLIEHGADVVGVADILFHNKPLNLCKLESIIYENFSTACNGKFAYIVIDPKWLEETGVKLHELHNLKGILRDIEGVQVSAFIRTDGDKTYVSMRSHFSINVCELARKFNIRGHAQAAGFSSALTPLELIPELISIIETSIEPM